MPVNCEIGKLDGDKDCVRENEEEENRKDDERGCNHAASPEVFAAVAVAAVATARPSALVRGSGSSDESGLSDVSDALALGLSELPEVSESSGMGKVY